LFALDRHLVSKKLRAVIAGEPYSAR